MWDHNVTQRNISLSDIHVAVLKELSCIICDSWQQGSMCFRVKWLKWHAYGPTATHPGALQKMPRPPVYDLQPLTFAAASTLAAIEEAWIPLVLTIGHKAPSIWSIKMTANEWVMIEWPGWSFVNDCTIHWWLSFVWWNHHGILAMAFHS